MSDIIEKDPQSAGGEPMVPPPDQEGGGRRRRRVNAIAFFAVFGLGVAIMILLIWTAPEVDQAPGREPVYMVATQKVTVSDRRLTVSVFGEIAAGQETDLRALVAGEVQEVSLNFRNGGAVRRDEMLLRIDPFEYEAQVTDTRAKISESEAAIKAEILSLSNERDLLALRKSEADRNTKLRKKGIVSDRTRDKALSDLKQQSTKLAQREASLASRRAKLTQLQVALQRAERNLTRTELRAPFDGFISRVTVNRGAVLRTSDKIARLVGAGGFEARGHLSNGQYGRLLQDGGLEGRPATVHWRVGDRTLKYDATITRINAGIDAASGGVAFFARINASGIDLPIRPGAFVEITLPGRRFPAAIRLPAAAVLDNGHVFVLADGRLSERKIALLDRAGNDVILSGDLKPGERVVLTRFEELRPGVRAEDPSLSGPATAAGTASDG